ncbi:MAG TPA: HEAT repeat domain-containing protein [Polyangia bacterium]|jgi:hypothetical protein|nr:HEAT repeat domain-containing protein [Polyangia bacterium]
MQTGRKRWGAAGAALLVAGAATLFLRHHRSATQRRSALDEPLEQAAGDRWRGFAAGTTVQARPANDAGASGKDWLAEQITPQQLHDAVDAWRQAILMRRSDAVLTLDRAFAVYPGRYGPELMTLAQSDPDERIRAFSTRVLGKIKNPELTDVFGRLLDDKSPFVRQNAAWALGELADRPGGRDAAQAAVADLERVQDTDPALPVRTAAGEALKKLQ